MRLLVLISDRPYPPISGTRVRNLYLWPAVCRLGVEVRVLGTDVGRDVQEPATFPGVDAEFSRFVRAWLPIRAWGAMTRSYHEFPQSEALARRVDEVAENWRPDWIHAEELRMAHYLPCLRGVKTSARQSVTFHNVESDLFEKIAGPSVPFGRSLAKRMQVQSLRNYEERAATRTDLRFAYSAHDRQRYAQLYPGVSWLTTRNGTDALGIRPGPQPSDRSILLLAAWSYHPNRVGLIWFLETVHPRLAQGTAVTVAGSGADDALRQQLAAHRVKFVDTPIDLEPLYREHALVVVPLLEGSGTRGKILEAIAHERLVVTTPKGVEGLELSDGEGLAIAEGPEALAGLINEVLASPEERSACARRGREAVIARYDWTVVAAQLKEAWDACVSR
jgi:glycosyltransferase involved in cell wall biosynthesis